MLHVKDTRSLYTEGIGVFDDSGHVFRNFFEVLLKDLTGFSTHFMFDTSSGFFNSFIPAYVMKL